MYEYPHIYWEKHATVNPTGEHDVGGVRLIFAHLATPHTKRPLCCVLVLPLFNKVNAHKRHGLCLEESPSKTGKLKAARVVVVVLHYFYYYLA